ncbi:hypothetical protein EST92_17560 [Streptomyces sp. TM32]|uniref:hypothetical protein n=1 Tax=Streptomyces sp. TM32 TaxID=1652669 RepID=UPI001012E40B|nr:hypothetical protein [Streptomyces sp. TM32]RXS80452.1 hypothetical protein EST92_17560 [Streptomyces sp. TM32]
MTQKTLTELVSAMNGQPTANEWDIVVSYSEGQLNDFLKKRYEQGELVELVSISTTGTNPITGDDFRIDYTVNFQTPTMNFILGRADVVRLTMPIGAGSRYAVTPAGAEKPSRSAEIPDGYSVVAIVPLAALSGDAGDVVDQGNVVRFEHGGPSTRHVVLHFRNDSKGTVFQVQPPPGQGPPGDILTTYFLPKLSEYFQNEVAEVAYVLAGVDNSQPSKDAKLFTPKSFAFASTGEEGAGCLSLFIQTAESGNPAGNAAPSFQPGGRQMSPVPTGYTASIILSHDLVTNAFFKPKFEAEGFTVEVESCARGALLSLSKDVSVIREGEDEQWIFGGHCYTGLRLSMKDFPLKLELSDGKATAKWTGRAESSWSEWTAGEGQTGHYGGVDVTIDLSKAAEAFSVTNRGIDFPEFKFTRDDFVVGINKHSCSFLERLGGCLETPPPFYSGQMTLQIPGINFSQRGLDYFLETNLLEPGRQMIEVDSHAGLGTPHDFLIVGKIVAA